MFECLQHDRDQDRVFRLFTRCTDYFLLQDGEAPGPEDALDLFRDVPPGYTPEALQVFGESAEGALIAAGALLPHYPARGVCYLPCMVVDPANRGHGVGRAFHDALCCEATRHGAGSLRLAVVDGNDGGAAFWRRLGYRTLRRVGPDRFKQRWHHRLEMELTFTSYGCAHSP